MFFYLSMQALLFTSFVFVCIDVRRYKSGIFYYPYLWLYLLTIFYFCIPSLYVEEISYYYNWNFQPISIAISKALSLYMFVVVFGFYMFFRKAISPGVVLEPLKKSQKDFVTAIAMLLFLGLLFIGVTQGFDAANQTIDDGYSGEASLTEDYKLKTLAYISMPIIATLVTSGKYILPLLLTVVIALLDAAQGGRTAAILPILTIYLSFAVRGNKLYVLTVAPVLILIYAVGIFLRPEELINFDAIPWQVAVLGEFRETFATLPIVIDRQFRFEGDLSNILISIVYPLLGPLRSVIEQVVVNPGAVMASGVGRGYGLGLNIFTESFYYFSTPGFLIAPWIISIFCLPFVNIFQKRTKSNLVLLCIFVIFIRLALREGIYPNSGLFLYLYITLIAVPVLIWKIMSVQRATSNSKE